LGGKGKSMVNKDQSTEDICQWDALGTFACQRERSAEGSGQQPLLRIWGMHDHAKVFRSVQGKATGVAGIPEIPHKACRYLISRIVWLEPHRYGGD
jgi:hypothetical protein